MNPLDPPSPERPSLAGAVLSGMLVASAACLEAGLDGVHLAGLTGAIMGMVLHLW